LFPFFDWLFGGSKFGHEIELWELLSFFMKLYKKLNSILKALEKLPINQSSKCNTSQID
jgi:hypothetical protein